MHVTFLYSKRQEASGVSIFQEWFHVKKKRLFQLSAFAILAVTLTAFVRKESPAPPAGDWPQWRGPNRDGISTETGLLKTWPASGPKVLWRAGSGEGYAGVAMTQGRVYTLPSENNRLR